MKNAITSSSSGGVNIKIQTVSVSTDSSKTIELPAGSTLKYIELTYLRPTSSQYGTPYRPIGDF